MSDISGVPLTTEQSVALFDVLTHKETYKEIEDFKYPGAVYDYGPPFQDALTSSQSPILQLLVSKFVLKLPGLRDVSDSFWRDRFEKLIQELAEAELSESYDKGILGIRKTIATATSALIEYPARGCLGGFPKRQVDLPKQLDISNPDQVLQAWQDALQEFVYGGLVDRLFAKTAETDDLSRHEPVVQGMHEFILVNLASIMHYTLILSPEGPTLLRMIEGVHKLIPYMLIRQTLKIGNVATMLSGLMKVILAKASVGSVTNWMGLSNGADEGMNLLQQIISQVLAWDRRELKKRADKIEKDKNSFSKEVRDELKAWIGRSRAEHEECRRQSQEQGKSIVAVILSLSSRTEELSSEGHEKALEYLSLQLAIRDRIEIVRVLCHRNPDVLTAAIKEAVDAYTPIIRQVHEAVNLSDTVWDFERFVTDTLKVSKPNGNKGDESPLGVEVYVDLLHRHQTSVHKFLHQVFKNGKGLVSVWKDYAHGSAAQFRNNETPPPSASVVSDKMATGGVRDVLNNAFAELNADDQATVRKELDAQHKYIQDLHASSAARISAVIKRTHRTSFGPGAYLARWQELMDNTRITPATAEGPIRYGSSKSVREETRKDVEGVDHSGVSEDQARKTVNDQLPEAPNTDTTWKLLGEKFKLALVAG